MNDAEYTEVFNAGQTTALNNLMCRVRAECSFGIISYPVLERVIHQMIDECGGECFKGGEANGRKQN